MALKGGSSCKNPRAADYVATPLVALSDVDSCHALMLCLSAGLNAMLGFA